MNLKLISVFCAYQCISKCSDNIKRADNFIQHLQISNMNTAVMSTITPSHTDKREKQRRCMFAGYRKYNHLRYCPNYNYQKEQKVWLNVHMEETNIYAALGGGKHWIGCGLVFNIHFWPRVQRFLPSCIGVLVPSRFWALWMVDGLARMIMGSQMSHILIKLFHNLIARSW